MKRFLVLAAATLLLASALPDEASAQRRGLGGAFHGGGPGVSGAGFRPAGLGIAGRSGWGAVGGPGWGFAGRSGLGWAAAGRTGLGWGIAGRPGWRPGWNVAGRPGWWRPGWARAGWGWGFPLAVGLGLGYASYGYADSYNDCLSWDGYRWVNVCYQSYPYSYW
jgi:hypothetical protein